MSMTKDERRARYERRTAYHTLASERRVRRVRRERDLSKVRVWWID